MTRAEVKCDGCGKEGRWPGYAMAAYPGTVIKRWCPPCARGAEHCRVVRSNRLAAEPTGKDLTSE